MAKRLFAWVLVLSLIFSLMPNVAAESSTAPGASEWCDHTSHEGWTEWTGTTALPKEAGQYYLSADVALTAAWEAPNGVHLCLNGHDVKQTTSGQRILNVNAGRTISIYDCAESYNAAGEYVGGVMTGGSRANGSAVWISRNGGVFNLYGGRISGNTKADDSYGGAIYLQSGKTVSGAKQDGAVFNMYGGELVGNGTSGKTLGGAVYLHGEGTTGTNIRGGEPATFNMYGGLIQGNKAYQGGAVYGRQDAIINIQGGEICDNAVSGSGGAIYTQQDMTLTVANAAISGNKAVNASAIYAQNNVQITVKDSTVTGNAGTGTSDEGWGAAFYVTGSGSKVTLQGEVYIKDNTVANAAIADLYLNGSSAPAVEVLHVDGMTGGFVVFGVHDKAASVAAATDVLSGTTDGFSTGSVAYLADAETLKHIGVVEGAFSFVEGHFHEGRLYLPWTDANALPDANSAEGVGYYLDTDVKALNATNRCTVTGGATLHLCLNGHTVSGNNAYGELFRVENGNLYLNDCTTVYDENGYYVSGGKVVDGLRKGNGAAIYANNAASVVVVEGVAFIGNEATETNLGYGGGAVQVRKNTTPAKFIGCLFSENVSAGGGGALALREGGSAYLEKCVITKNKAVSGAAIYTTTGNVELKECKITENETTDTVGAIAILGTSNVTITDSTITANKTTHEWYGAVNLSNGSSTVKLVGKTVIYDNLNKNGAQQNVHLQAGETIDFDMSGLTEGAKIGVTLYKDRVTAGDMFFSTTGMTAVPSGVTSDNDTYEVYVDDQGRLALKEKEAGGEEPPVTDTHSHTLCNDASCTSHGDAVTFEKWDDPTTLPTEGNYYLAVDVNLTAAVETTGTLNLCLNGHTVKQTTAEKRILGVKIGTTTSITDCGTTGTITGGTATYGSAISVRHASTFNLFAGKITGNSSESEGTVYIQGGKIDKDNNYPVAGTFNMYGGEISGNTTKMGGAISTAAPVGAVTQNPAINIYGGKITGNTTTSRGSAINASGTATIYIENAEISGNTSGGDGTIYATNGPTLTVKNAKIKDNESKTGAAFSVYGGTVTLDGAVIENNHSTGGFSAVHAAVSAAAGTPTVVLKGATVITGNTNGEDKTPCNLYLRNNVMFDVSGLTDAAKIGLYRQSAREQDRVSTAALASANELARFESDQETYEVDRDAEGYLVMAAATSHKHKLCNDASCTAHGGDVAFRKWTATDSLPTEGNWYLENDVNLTAIAYAEGDLVLCLNGHTITQTAKTRVLQTRSGGSLTITDCGTTGTITGGVNDTGASIFVTDGTTFNLYGGKITGSRPSTSNGASSGSAIFLRCGSGEGATFNMYGGEITDNGNKYSWGGAISNGSNNKNYTVYVNIYGGKIYGNTAGTGGAIRLENSSVLTIYGGEIYDNEATTGGAIYLARAAEMNLQGGKITGNTADTAGGIYVPSTAKVTVSGNPVVYDNTVENRQNNLYLAGSSTITLGDVATDAKIGVTAATIGRAISTETDTDYTAIFVGDLAKQPVTYKDKTLWIDARVETSDHIHSVCTGVKHGTCDHDEDQMWIKWGDDEDEKNALPTTSGYYYLTQDIQLSQAFVMETKQDISICLNGKTVTAVEGNRHFATNTGTTVNITDCSTNPGGFTGGSRTYGGSVNIVAGSTFNLYAGRFYGNTAPDSEGGAIYMQASKLSGENYIDGGTFNMYGGEISGNTAKYGAAIRPAGNNFPDQTKSSTVNIYGGIITGNKAVYQVTVGEDGTEAKSGGQGGAIAATNYTELNLYGGSIEGNTADADGGAIYMLAGTKLYIKGGKIEGNSSTITGGGIFAYGAGTTITMDDGEITGNSSKSGGGMITQTRSFFTMNGGKISGNTATSGGAGIYVSTNTDFVMNGGIISGNQASSGGGFYALRSRVTLSGGEIAENKATYRAGGFQSSGGTIEINKVTIRANEAPEGGAAYINRTTTGSGETLKAYPSTVNINDGALITGNKGGTNCGGLLIANDGVVVTMNGGEISKNTSTNGAGFMTWRGSTFIFKGGKIVNNVAKNSGGGGYVSTASTFKMEGGSITNNTAKSGAGLYVYRSEADFAGGTVSYNRAQHTSTWKNGKETKSGGTAGAMYISGAKVNLKGTSFIGNYSSINGGAIMMGRASYTEGGVKKIDTVTVNIYSGLFSDNKTEGAGGGMLIQSEGTVVNMYGGTFTGNSAKNAGAIYVSTKTTFNMTGGTVTRNESTATAGGIYVLKSTANITGGQIYGNTAATSAGMIMVSGDTAVLNIKNMKLHDGLAKTAGLMVVQSRGHVFAENCDIYDNRAEGSSGGAVYISNNSFGDFTDCKFYNNTTTNYSGAMHCQINSKVNITRCDFTENTAGTISGAMYCNPRSVITITDSTFSKNTAGETGGALVCRGTMYLTNVTIENCSAANGGAIATDTNNTGGAGVMEGLIIRNSEFRNNTATQQGGAFYIWKGRPLHLYDSKITGNTAGTEGGAIWAYEDVELHSTEITGNTSGGEGYAVYMNDANYDGHSYYTSKNKLSGNTIIKDNQGGDLWMGPDVTFAITADGLGENVHIELTMDSGVVTNRILGAYHYEGGNQVYTITYGDRSMTDPEFDASLVKTDEGDEQKNAAASSDLLLYVGVGVFALAVIALVVVLIAKKKKAGKTAEKANKE